MGVLGAFINIAGGGLAGTRCGGREHDDGLSVAVCQRQEQHVHLLLQLSRLGSNLPAAPPLRCAPPTGCRTAAEGSPFLTLLLLTSFCFCLVQPCTWMGLRRPAATASSCLAQPPWSEPPLLENDWAACALCVAVAGAWPVHLGCHRLAGSCGLARACWAGALQSQLLHPPCAVSSCCRQLYAGMAELVGLPGGGPPEDRLLLTQFNLSSGDSAVYSDLKVNQTLFVYRIIHLPSNGVLRAAVEDALGWMSWVCGGGVTVLGAAEADACCSATQIGMGAAVCMSSVLQRGGGGTRMLPLNRH